MSTESLPLPFAERRSEDVPGHWLLARLGKRVLRPGGAELSARMLQRSGLAGSDVVELAPGLGRTAAVIVSVGPRSYTGIDRDPDARARTARVVAGVGTCLEGEAAETGLDEGSADVVVGEAMLTMQGDRGKAEIIAEAVRILRPGGRYAIHELGLTPDSLDPEVKTAIRKDLARSIKVNARPLTMAEWTRLLEEAGLVVDWTDTAPMALLEPRRNLADEGVGGVLRILGNVLRDRGARKRVLQMRSTFRRYRHELIAVALVAHRPEDSHPARGLPDGQDTSTAPHVQEDQR